MKIRAAQTTNPSAFLVNGNQDIVAAGRGADFPGQAAQLICIARGGGTEGAYGYDLDQQKFVKTYYFNADESVCSVQLIRQR